MQAKHSDGRQGSVTASSCPRSGRKQGRCGGDHAGGTCPAYLWTSRIVHRQKARGSKRRSDSTLVTSSLSQQRYVVWQYTARTHTAKGCGTMRKNASTQMPRGTWHAEQLLRRRSRCLDAALPPGGSLDSSTATLCPATLLRHCATGVCRRRPPSKWLQHLLLRSSYPPLILIHRLEHRFARRHH